MSLRKFADQEEAVRLLGEADRRRLGVTEGPGATASTDPSLTSGGSTGGTRAVFPLACGSSIWCRGLELVPRHSATGCPGIRACVGDLKALGARHLRDPQGTRGREPGRGGRRAARHDRGGHRALRAPLAPLPRRGAPMKAPVEPTASGQGQVNAPPKPDCTATPHQARAPK